VLRNRLRSRCRSNVPRSAVPRWGFIRRTRSSTACCVDRRDFEARLLLSTDILFTPGRAKAGPNSRKCRRPPLALTQGCSLAHVTREAATPRELCAILERLTRATGRSTRKTARARMGRTRSYRAIPRGAFGDSTACYASSICGTAIHVWIALVLFMVRRCEVGLGVLGITRFQIVRGLEPRQKHLNRMAQDDAVDELDLRTT
jgi:hypothetical protein